MEQKYQMTILNPKTKALETYDIRTGALIIADGVLTSRPTFAYSHGLADAICALVAEGKGLSEIAVMEGFPPAMTMFRWAKLYPEFASMLEEAKKFRSELYHDKAVSELEQVDPDDPDLTRDKLAARKMKVDSYMRLSEKGTSNEKGGKGGTQPLQIIVNTGIVRDNVKPVTVEVISDNSKDT